MLSYRLGTVNDFYWELKPVLSYSKPHTFSTFLETKKKEKMLLISPTKSNINSLSKKANQFWFKLLFTSYFLTSYFGQTIDVLLIYDLRFPINHYETSFYRINNTNINSREALGEPVYDI